MASRSLRSLVLPLVLLGAFAGCGGPTTPALTADDLVVGEFLPANEGLRLEEVIAGIPEAGGKPIAETRTKFAPDEQVLLHGFWTQDQAKVDAYWDWYAPSGAKVYESHLPVERDWRNTWVKYRGEMPMDAGVWTVQVRDGEASPLGRFRFEIVRDVSDIPVRQQALAFEEAAFTDAQGSALALAIREAVASSDASAAVSSLPDGAAAKQLQLGVTAWTSPGKATVALGNGDTLGASVTDAVGQLAGTAGADVVYEISLLHSTREIPATEAQVEQAFHGNVGFTLKVGDKASTLLPNAIYRADALQGSAILGQLATDAGLGERAWEESGAVLHTFATQEWVLPAGADAARPMASSRAIVFPEEIDVDRLRTGVNDTITWYLTNQKDDGRYMYTFFPGKDLEPNDDWCLRVINTVWVMSEFGRDLNRPDVTASVIKAAEMYAESLVEEDGGKWLDWKQPRKDVGLGSTAFMLSTFSVLNRPQDKTLRRELANAILNEQDATGRFSTSFRGSDREVDQQYYPGEAMVGLMRYLQADGDPRAKEALEKAFLYYSAFWEREKHGPFVPWQIRAFHDLYRIDPRPEYRTYVFSLMDWMLDTMPPLGADRGWAFAGSLRAMPASTGVYMEGLVHAYLLARDTNDEARTARYGAALAGGYRYLLGLQFKDTDVHAFARPEKVFGALATKPTNQELRLDFTYHGMNALHIGTLNLSDDELAEMMSAAYPGR